LRVQVGSRLRVSTLLISEQFPPYIGGSGRWLWEVYRRLPREKYTLAVGEHPDQATFDATHNLDVVRMPLTFREVGLSSRHAFAGYWRLSRRLRSLARDTGVSKVHAGRSLPEGWLALLMGLPFICTAHGEEVNRVARNGTGGSMSSRELRWMTGVVLRRARRVIANSQSTRRILEEQWRLPAKRVRVVHPGVDTRQFLPARSDPEVRHRLGWGTRPVVLTVARLQRRKGQDQMIRAIGQVAAQVPEVLYAVVGAGEDDNYLRQLARACGVADRVQFLGQLSDETLIDCYQQCDLFVLPNRQDGTDIEGFGMVLLEAQACGRPVIAGDSGGTADAVKVPEAGQLVESDHPGPLAEAVSDLLLDPERRSRMGQAARAWVVAGFDWAAVGQQAAAALA
jgi:phosphatidylinositol alpha-1,6-mannosyltransferase